MTTMRSVLVVDDEAPIRSILRSYLEDEGFAVGEADTGERALEHIERNRFDLVILDVRLPGIDGFEVLRRIRRKSDLPVIMLTARTEETDTLIGLEIGADDYITKPFSPREVVARAKTVLRRGQTTAPEPEFIELNGLRLDTGAHEVTVDGRPIDLTALEFRLLEALASAPGRVFTRAQLIERIWGWDFFGEERIVDVHVGNLRKALGDSADAPRFVATVRGVGYKFVPPT
jgi:DNA-binding response OmpR family regulator